jgi:ELWxxDGT repeat protein
MVYNNKLLFLGYDSDHGLELWESDGTTAGTHLFKDLEPGPQNAFPSYFTPYDGGFIFFTTAPQADGSIIYSLWNSTGTAESTVKLREFEGLYYEKSIVPAGKQVYFACNDGLTGMELWKTDGTPAGTVLVKDISPGVGSANPKNFFFFKDKLFFSVDSYTYGRELWRSDGTATDTHMVKDISSASYSSDPHTYSVLNNQLFFHGVNRLWIAFTIFKTDGTAEGTVDIGDWNAYYSMVFKKRLFFSNLNGKQIKSTVGFPSEIQIHAEIAGTNPNFLVATDSVLYFTAFNSATGKELWRTNGTQAGTYFIKDIRPGYADSSPNNGFTFKDEVYFLAEDDVHGMELWKIRNLSNVISGKVYFDQNADGQLQDHEPGLWNQRVVIEPGNIILYTNQSGEYYLEADSTTYTITVEVSDDWQISSKNHPYTLTIPGTAQAHFGLSATTARQELRMSLTQTGRSRCGSEVQYWLAYHNNGNVPINGQLSLQPDASVTYLQSIPTPDAGTPQLLSWSIQDLAPGKIEKVMLKFKMPGFDAIGDTIRFYSQASISDAEIILKDTLQQVITCSYDPNDKEVFPAGIGEEHLTLKGSWLDYTIRFQNTGTDTAFNVVLRDTLDLNLDSKTFEILSNSHTMQARLKEMALEFRFANILLPDSIVDEPGSHGFVRYRIKAKTGIAEKTVVENKAYIHFDSNPPIVTNTNLNTLVSTLPQREVTGLQEDQQKLQLFPNPTGSSIHIQSQSPFREVRVYNSLGQLQVLRQYKTASTLQNLDLSHIPAGLYIISIQASGEQMLHRVVKE